MGNTVSLSQAGALPAQDRMAPLQVFAVAVCVFINGLDGFDVLAIAFTAPAIARDWQLSPVALGSLFSAGLIGMSVGAFFLSPLGDRIGRHNTILVCLGILGAGMLLSAAAENLLQLWTLRCFTGLGIGGMLASINTVTAEYASPRRRDLCIALMSLGYPIGATLGGGIAAFLIAQQGWRSVYAFGGALALVLVPVVLFGLPESLDFLLVRQPRGALARVNRILHRLGREPLAVLPAQPASAARQGSLAAVLAPERRGDAALICLAYFGVMLAMYFVLSWTPKLLVELGFSDAGGISGSMLMNLAGIAGCLLLGLGTNRFGLRRLSVLIMLGLFAGLVFFGVVPAQASLLLLAVIVLGFCMYGCIAALYAMVPVVFPVEGRTTGTGLALGVGRLGAITGPYLAGIMIAAGWSRASYCLVLALPLLVAAAATWKLRSLRD